MPRYADYHRTVIGYHGTKKESARRIIQGDAEFEPSENDDDWLGHGVYFWEYAPQQAWLWATHRKRTQGWKDDIAVVASMIRLGNCFDLLDPENVKDLGRFYQAYVKASEANGSPPRSNVKSRKRLNRAVFNFAYEALEETEQTIDTCRAVFVPTTTADRIWTGSGINAHAHIQICIRNMGCILGTWLVKPLEDSCDAETEAGREESTLGEHDPSLGAGDPEAFS